MSDVSNADLMNVLLTVKGDIGGIKAELAAHAATFTTHCEDDKRLAIDVKSLELSAASAAGKRMAFATMGSFFGAALALVVDYIRK